MAGVKGKCGGKRPGAGRPKGSGKKSVTVVAPAATQNGQISAKSDPVATPVAPADTTPQRVYDNPLDFLMDAVNNSGLDMSLRVRAALSAAQYKHKKPHDGGKKEERADAAKKVGSGGRFAASPPPKLQVVNNR